VLYSSSSSLPVLILCIFIIMLGVPKSSVLLDEVAEQVTLALGSGGMEAEAADHNDVQQGDSEGCRAADAQ
jgi:hypothetical protein